MLQERTILLEIDLINDFILEIPPGSNLNSYNELGKKKIKITESLKEKFLDLSVDNFWHSDKDKLEFFQYFSDGTYFCQRSKKIHDFQNESTYFKSYQFTGASKEQARELYTKFVDLHSVSLEVKNLTVEQKVAEVDKEIVYWEQRWYKLKRQRGEMLISSDWRVLPDVAEKYPGERDRWVAWRSWIRNYTIPSPSDPIFNDDNGNSSGLKYFKYTYEHKFPIDPSNYRRLYPNDMLDDGVTPAPAFMDENDANQWVKHDVEASTDFFQSREQNMFNLAKRGVAPAKKVNQSLIDMMKILKVDEEIPVNWDRYYTDESEL